MTSEESQVGGEGGEDLCEESESVEVCLEERGS